MTRRSRSKVEQPSGSGWVTRYPLGAVDAARAMGTVSAPLLAGFALAVIATVSTSDKQPKHGHAAVAAFAVGACLFVFCVQFTVVLVQYSAPLSERQAWLSVNTTANAQQVAVKVQRRDNRLQARYLLRARLTFDLGVLSHLLGLMALVWPRTWLSWQTPATVAVSAALALELWWIVGTWLGRSPTWLLPGYLEVVADDD